MKKKLLLEFAACTTTVVIIAITLNVTFKTNSSDLSDITLTNVEALARNEGGNCGCYGPKVANYNGTIVYCRCENDKCCMDEQGCN